jgi:hypothetical protein
VVSGDLPHQIDHRAAVRLDLALGHGPLLELLEVVLEVVVNL